jgi:eukaryotic-like serine/threonine-protein kinase
MKFMLIPPGEFLMGVDPAEIDIQSLNIVKEDLVELFHRLIEDASPRHRVRITKPFYIQAEEVSIGQMQKVLGKLPTGVTDNRPNSPVTGNITLFEATEFCNALSKLEGKSIAYHSTNGKLSREMESNGYRLPTEAEWEYACRAGSSTIWFFGNDPHGTKGDSGTLIEYERFLAGANTKANPFGLFDLYGGSTEWCFDRRAPYTADDATDPYTEPEGDVGVARGGSSTAGGGKDTVSINSFARAPWPGFAFEKKWYGMGRVVLPIEMKAPPREHSSARRQNARSAESLDPAGEWTAARHPPSTEPQKPQLRPAFPAGNQGQTATLAVNSFPASLRR